jgi:hypothetical protein
MCIAHQSRGAFEMTNEDFYDLGFVIGVLEGVVMFDKLSEEQKEWIMVACDKLRNLADKEKKK